MAGENAKVYKQQGGTQPSNITDISNSATGTQLATAVNAILAVLRGAGLTASS